MTIIGTSCLKGKPVDLTYIFLAANTTHILYQSPTNLAYNLQLTHISCNHYIIQ